MSIKFLLLGGRGMLGFLGGGGECRFYFYGRADFSDKRDFISQGLCFFDVLRPFAAITREGQGTERVSFFGSSQTGCFKPGRLQFLRGSSLLRSLADLRLRSFALFCGLTRQNLVI